MTASIISFCSNDFRFIDACIEGARPFSDVVIVCVSDHFFDGSTENRALLDIVYAKHPYCTFLEFPFASKSLMNSLDEWGDPSFYHRYHNLNRLIGFLFSPPEINRFFFIDSDEIIDGMKMKQFLSSFDSDPYDALRFASYWYFREACYQAVSHDDTALMVKRSAIDLEFLMDPDERMGIFCSVIGKRMGSVYGIDGQPMLHHYSWVRTKEEMIKKCSSWGHRSERDWLSLIETEYSSPFKGKDFIRGYTYRQVVPYFDPLAVIVPQSEGDQRRPYFPHVRQLTDEEIFRRDVACRFLDQK